MRKFEVGDHFGSSLGRFGGSFGVGDHFGSCTDHLSENALIFYQILSTHIDFVDALVFFLRLKQLGIWKALILSYFV